MRIKKYHLVITTKRKLKWHDVALHVMHRKMENIKNVRMSIGEVDNVIKIEGK